MTAAARRRARQRTRLIRIQWLVILALLIALVVSIATQPKPESVTVSETSVTPTPEATATTEPAATVEAVRLLYTDEEVMAIALTLAGECYDDMTEDKIKVAEVIVNRVSANGFGSTVLEVVSAPYQFLGYHAQSRAVSDNDIEVAEAVLQAWYDNDCKALSDWLYFSAGENHENVFRTTFN